MARTKEARAELSETAFESLAFGLCASILCQKVTKRLLGRSQAKRTELAVVTPRAFATTVFDGTPVGRCHPLE